jgi:IMP dehydrogenase/GMP reductase
MLGRAFAQTKESAGWEIDLGFVETSNGLILQTNREPGLVKRYRGQASASFQSEVLGRNPDAAEGATTGYFSPSGTVKQVCDEYRSALRSAISYSGHTSLDEFSGGVSYIRCTGSSASEAKPHGLSAA